MFFIVYLFHSTLCLDLKNRSFLLDSINNLLDSLSINNFLSIDFFFLNFFFNNRRCLKIMMVVVLILLEKLVQLDLLADDRIIVVKLIMCGLQSEIFGAILPRSGIIFIYLQLPRLIFWNKSSLYSKSSISDIFSTIVSYISFPVSTLIFVF